MPTTLPTTHEREAELTLPDGRTLGYTLHGASDGPLVVVLDGPASRGLARAASPIAVELGLRLVAPDRPGFFKSTRKPHRAIADWPADHAALLDHLGAERAGILAQSGGTPYALLAAQALPERVTGVAVLGAVAPMGERENFAVSGKEMKASVRLARRAPWLLRALLRRQDPDKMASKARAQLPPADREVVEDPRLWALNLQATREILSQPEGMVEEFRLLGRPWGFALEPGTVPVAFWSGDADAWHPTPHSRYLAERLGGAPVHVVAGAATFGLMARYGDALRFAARA